MKLRKIVCLALAASIIPARLLAQGADELAALRTDIAAIKENQQKIQKSLRAVRDLLMGKQPEPEDVFLTVAGHPAIGESSAKATVVEFSDFQCPYCGAYARETFDRVRDEYVKTGKIRYVVRSFPLQSAHPQAQKAAEAALCAADQGKYWEAHERFFSNQARLAIENMADHAAAIGADPSKFKECIDSGKYVEQVAEDFADGQDAGVQGTPTFFIGFPDPTDGSRIQARKVLVGNVAYREFQKALEEVLKSDQQEGGHQ